MVATRPSTVRPRVLRDREDLPGRRLDHDDHRLAAAGVHRVLSGVLHHPVQGDRDRRRRRPLDLVQHRDVDTVLVDADDPPARLAVELVDHGLFHLGDDGRREMRIGRQNVGLRCDHDAGQPADRREDLVVVVGMQGDAQIQRLGRRAGLFGQQLRVVQRVVERVQGVDHRVRRLDQGGPGLRRVQRVVVQVARRQDVAAAQFVHRGAPRRIGPQRERLMLTQPGMQPGGGPADLPVPFVARHLQLAVVAPGPVLGQMPGEAVADRAGVLGVFRAEHLRVQVGGLQPGPGRVERFAGLVGVVAELGGRRGVADGQRAKELLRRRAGTLGPRGASRQRDDRDEQRLRPLGPEMSCCQSFCCHRD